MNHNNIERFVPTGVASLMDDAPGWSGDTAVPTATVSQHKGPICWKCRGLGKRIIKNKKKKKNNNKRRRKEKEGYTCSTGIVSTRKQQQSKNDIINNNNNNNISCTVCQGNGYLLPKQQEMNASKTSYGEITRSRKHAEGWKSFGPLPFAVLQQQQQQQQRHGNNNNNNSTNYEKVLYLLQQLAAPLQQEITIVLGDDEGDKSNSTNKDNNVINFSSNHCSSSNNNNNTKLPIWLPQCGEQLCNLLGSWRILQRVASHRWTTDDLVTSYMVGRVYNTASRDHQPIIKKQNDSNNKMQPIRYLDLGCGNGSVLLMTTWQLLTRILQQQQQQNGEDDDRKHTSTTTSCNISTPPSFSFDTSPLLFVTGIEARQEAVQLARRSIAFNLGDQQRRSSNNNSSNSNQGDSICHPYHPLVDIHIHHGDFRSVLEERPDMKESYDIVTGTPPYFRVDFTVEEKEDNDEQEKQSGNNNSGKCGDKPLKKKIIRKAVINQGGMPTCKQSAPARCEFRGGVEAYCQAAEKAMHSQSFFCVCENWLNNDRVYDGASKAGLVITEVLPIKGRTGKPNPLFAVYVMRKQNFFNNGKNKSKHLPGTAILDCLHVRNEEGKWTESYQSVLETMSIPVVMPG